ncbi:MAG: hypothetical protein WBH47_09300 [Streptosporangiaceae bacterium]
MKNHGEKTKDMIESVLPSTARKRAREQRRLIHKRARARQRVALAAVRATYDDASIDFRDGRRRSELKWMVLDRQAADNVGALTRWAAAVVKADARLRAAPLHVQVAHFAAILPSGVIGAHAVQHIEWALTYLARRPARDGRRGSWRDRPAERQRILAEALRQVIAWGGHGDFNDALRRVYGGHGMQESPPAAGRFLRGAHDIDAFSAEMAHLGWVLDAARSAM